MPAAPASTPSAKPITRPGRTVDATLGELLKIDENEDVVVEWRERMAEIAESERSAENDEGVRIR